MHRSAIFLCVLLGVWPLHAAEPASWPNWMGPRRDGISREVGWSTKWPDDGLPVVWTKEIGIGFSSISIAAGRLYTLGFVDGEEVVWCLNPANGNELWSYRYGSKLNPNLHEGGPASTPTIEGDRVYTLGKEGQLYCFHSATGAIRWQKSLQQDLEIRTPEWGFSSSAVIDGDQLLLEAGRVVSYDKNSGTRQWQTPKHEAGYGSAAVFESPAGTKRVATLDCEGLRILTLKTGEQLAFQPWPSPFRTNATTPIVSGDQIYISTAYQVGCGLFDFNGTDLKQVYANKGMRNHFCNRILYEGHLYGFDGNSNLGRVVQVTCMNLESGKVAWKQAGFGCGSLILANGKLVLLSESGTLVIANATPRGYEEVARSPFLEGRCWTTPVLLGSRIYGRNAAGRLVCVELPRE
ncbi:MAG: PQQ-like beta-propeller repeat protein [Planctomycetes bacterium]|nr:PQQ-like beta-propeller repeat protein [Planctomycetota bacterium]